MAAADTAQQRIRSAASGFRGPLQTGGRPANGGRETPLPWPPFDIVFCDIKDVKLLLRKLIREILRKPCAVAGDLFVQPHRRHPIEPRQVGIEHHPLPVYDAARFWIA